MLAVPSLQLGLLNLIGTLSSGQFGIVNFPVGVKSHCLDILSFLREWHFGQPVLNVPVQHIQTLPLDTSSYAEVGMASRDGISSTGFQLIPNS